MNVETPSNGGQAQKGWVNPLNSQQVFEPRLPNGSRYDYAGLCLATPEMLENVMRMGVTPDLKNLSGWEFRGYNTPAMMDLLGIRKFKKGFYRENASNGYESIQGYNVGVRQNSFGEPWIDVVKGGESKKFGWYNVTPVKLTDADYKYPNAVLINYNCDKNFMLDPSRQLRDYLVQIYPDQPDLFLGKAFIAVGPLRFFVSYFVLERLCRSTLTA